MEDIYIVSGVRTAIGDFGKSLKDIAPTRLGELVIRAVLSATGIAGADVQHVVMGNVIHTEPRDAYLSRAAAVDAPQRPLYKPAQPAARSRRLSFSTLEIGGCQRRPAPDGQDRWPIRLLPAKPRA